MNTIEFLPSRSSQGRGGNRWLRCVGATKEGSKVGWVSFLWMCVGGCQGRFPRRCDGCCCREDMCNVWRLNYQSENSNHRSLQGKGSGMCPSIWFRSDLLLNFSVSSSSKIKILGLRKSKTAKLLGKNRVAMATAPTRGQFCWLEGRRERRGCTLIAAK